MIKEIRKNIKLIIVIVVIVSVFGWVSSYAATIYAINSSNVEYQDNSGLGVTNVQAAIDGTCTKFSNQLTNLKKEVINEMYPKGSIYITTELTTESAVAQKLGGTWEKYSQGRVLIGEGTGTDSDNISKVFNINSSSGTYNHKHTSPLSFIRSSDGTGYVGITNDNGLYERNFDSFFGSKLDYEDVGGLTGLAEYVGYYTTPEANIPPYTTVYMYRRTA